MSEILPHLVDVSSAYFSIPNFFIAIGMGLS